MNDLKIKTSHAIDLISQLGPQGGNNTRQTTATLAKTEMIYPKNVGAQVAMDFT